MRELEYQDAEWKAFLKQLGKEMMEHKEKVRGAKELSWDERVAAKEQEAAERKDVKRKRAELEAERDQMQAEAAANAADFSSFFSVPLGEMSPEEAARRQLWAAQQQLDAQGMRG